MTRERKKVLDEVREITKTIEAYDILKMAESCDKDCRECDGCLTRLLFEQEVKDMITVNNTGTHSFLSDEDAEKLRKFDKIVEILNGSDPYHGNRETCDKIRRVTEGSDTNALPMSDIRRIAAYYGTEDQTRQLVEEMAELMVALSKWKRNECNAKVQDELRESMAHDIVTEIADVRIMLEQIIFLYDIPESRIDSEIRYKVKRQVERIEAERAKTAEPGNATKIGDRLRISSET